MAKFANFEIEVEIKELKIHVKGDREIAPEVANNVAQQISGIFQPAGLIEAPKDGHNGHSAVEPIAATPARKPGRRRSTSGISQPSGAASTPNWNHEPAKWGTPVQTWKQWQKIMWLLYVAEQAAGKNALSTKEMVDIFKAKFLDAGLLVKGNIPRDLGSQATYFGSADGRWHLKQEGKAEALRLVAQAKGETIAA